MGGAQTWVTVIPNDLPWKQRSFRHFWDCTQALHFRLLLTMGTTPLLNKSGTNQKFIRPMFLTVKAHGSWRPYLHDLAWYSSYQSCWICYLMSSGLLGWNHVWVYWSKLRSAQHHQSVYYCLSRISSLNSLLWYSYILHTLHTGFVMKGPLS